jgi:predicted nucleotidyltransferase
MAKPSDPKLDLDQLLTGAGVIVAYLFGSRAAGTHSPNSDADVGILADREIGLLEQERLADRLAGALGVEHVDVVLLNRAPLELRGHVVQDGRPLFVADESRRVDFEVRTRSEYLDFLPTLNEHTRSYLKRVAEKGL